ncbi:MAG: TauD/TfdA family dioxygenase [Gammaproteobacteria bacterium]|nr:TauD/TfdA family dioxygenase [Gammaproteobacteria bacterium]
MNSVVSVTPLGATLAAMIEDVDLSDLDDKTFAAIKQAFLKHLVLVFPNQILEPAAQVSFTHRFGKVEPHPLRARPGVKEHPEVMILENRPGKPGARGDEWHSDITYAERPPALSVLYCLNAPPDRGDTMFCNMYQAYETLSDGCRQLLDTLNTVHTAESLAQRNNEPGTDALPILEIPPPVVHPVVRTHPETKGRALFVNESFTVNFENQTREESAPLLNYLHCHSTRAENAYRQRWSKGDVVMWDNRCAMHYAVHDYDEFTPRLMHRTTAAGERPY